MVRVPLQRMNTARVRVVLDAVIEKPGGDLVLEGQDLGAAVREMWGDSDYEYWVTVKAAHREELLQLLVKERFDDAGGLVDWLKNHRFRITGSGGGAIGSTRVDRDGLIRVTTDAGTVTIHDSVFDRVTLTLLKNLFTTGRFEHDAAFRAWLTDQDLPSGFASYA